MKKKNWILNLLLALIVLPCLVLLSACGEGVTIESGAGEAEAVITGFSVYIDETLVSNDSKTINVTYGDTVNLEERITVKLIYDDGSTKTIAKGTDGYTLTGVPDVFNAGSYDITIGYGSYTGIQITLVVAKATPSTPTARTGVLGNSLSTVALPEGWAWDAPNTLLEESGNYKASYAGTANYNAVASANVAVTVTGERAEGVVARLDLGEIEGLTEETFKNWVVNNYLISIGDADLTETQFDALIAHMNETYNEGVETQLPTFNVGKVLYDENTSYLSYFDLDDGVDYEYLCHNFGGEHYSIRVVAYQIGGEGNIHLISCEIMVQSPYNGVKLVNSTNPEDIITITFNGESETTGTIVWGELSGTYEISGENNDILEIQFGGETPTTATGTIDMQNITAQVNYNEVEYTFKELNFNVDTTTGMLYRSYDAFNTYKTNQKIKATMAFTKNGMEERTILTEWKEGNSSFVSFKRDQYDVTTSGLISSYEEIYDVSDERVYLFYVEGENKYSKVVDFATFLTKLQELDPTISSMEEVLANSASYMFFGVFMGVEENPDWNRQDFIDNFSAIGSTKIDGVWYDIEGYDFENGVAKFFVKDEMFGIKFEGGTGLFADLNFTDYPTRIRHGYSDWSDTDLNATLAEIYSNEDEGGGEGGEFIPIVTTYRDQNESSNYLVITQTSENAGEIVWGEMQGTFTMAEQDPVTDVLDLTIVITSGMGATINAELDRSNNTITFNYNSTDYTFEFVSPDGGEGGGEQSTPTSLFEDYNLPINFKAVWTDSMGNTYSIIKVGEEACFSASFTEGQALHYYYKKQGVDNYMKYYFDGELWIEEQAMSLTEVNNEANFRIHLKTREDVFPYIQQSSSDYESFTECRVYALESVGTIYLHNSYDLIVANTMGEPLTTEIELTSLSTEGSTFADYGISDLPTV